MRRRSLRPAAVLGFLIILGAGALPAQEASFPVPRSLTDLERAVAAQAGKINGRTGVFIKHVESGETVGLRDGERFQLASVFKINIDHHYSNTPYADINWIDPEAPAVGEMVFDLSRFLGVTPTPEIAEDLYCAIFSDTGSFHFSNTTPRALAAAAELARLGASPIRVAEKLCYNNRPEKILLLGRVLSSLSMNDAGTIAVITMFKRDTQALGLKEVDTEDMTTLARTIQSVEMVMFFKEMGPETFRVSLRSKGSANAARVAEHFGGGGHVHASGFTVYGPYDKLVREVPAIVEALLADKPRDPSGPAA